MVIIGTAYFDASGKKEDEALAVAGFLTPVNKWHRFEREWGSCLAIYDVPALHMKDYAHSRRAFKSWRDDENLRIRFLRDLIRLISDFADMSFAATVYMSDYLEVNRTYCLKEWAHPYAIAGLHCIGKVQAWADEFKYDRANIDCVFESGDEGKGHLLRMSSEILGLEPLFKPKEASVAFQAADLIAYENYKANLTVIEKGVGLVRIDDLRIPFQKLSTIPGSANWGVVWRDNLIEECQRYGVPLRQQDEASHLG